MASLVVVGGGNMGSALAAGLLHSGWRAEDITIVERLDARRKELATLMPGVTLSTKVDGAFDGAIVAVKPHDVEAACAEISASGCRRVLSIAAAVSIASLESWLSDDAHVVRAMPNTPAQVGAGAAAIAPGSRATNDDMDWAASILGAVGIVVRVPETLLDAVTGLSGSGPAYVFLLAEALIDAGVLNGLPREVAEALTKQTLLGASRLMIGTAGSVESLRAAVTTPGGTTAAGLSALEHRAFRAAINEAVTAATARAKELGGS